MAQHFRNIVQLFCSDGWLSSHIKFLAEQFVKGGDLTPLKAATWLVCKIEQFDTRVAIAKEMLERHPAQFAEVIIPTKKAPAKN